MPAVTFSDKDAKRISDVVQRVERSPVAAARNQPQQSGIGAIRWMIRGKLAGTLSAGNSATLNVWAWNGTSEADTGETLTVWDWLLQSGDALTSGTKVMVSLDVQSRRYYVYAAECN